MSGHGHEDASTAYEAHDDHHETSSDDFPADEPRSPGWLPLLGGALFLAGILACIVFGGDDSTTTGDTAAAAPPPTTAAAPPSAAPRPAMRLPSGFPLPAGHAAVPQAQ